MTTGVFHVPGKTGGGRHRKRVPARGNGVLAARRAAERATRLSEFAEALSEGFTVEESSQLVGIGADRGKKYLADIRRSLGWQAV